MAESHCRVTVVGSRRRVDIALPVQVPLAELVLDLVKMLEEPRSEEAGHVWALSRLGQDGLPLELRPVDLGLVDGELIYLSDQHRAEAPATVEDVVEAVQDVVDADPQAWEPRLTSRLVLAVAGVLAVAVSGHTLITAPADRRLGLALGLLGLGLLALVPVAERFAQRADVAHAGAVVAAPFTAAAAALLLSDGSAAAVVASAAAGLGLWTVLTLGLVPTLRAFALGVAPSAVLVLVTGLVTWGRSALATAALVGLGETLLIGVLPHLAAAASGLAKLDDRSSTHGPPGAQQVGFAVGRVDSLLTWSLVAVAATSLPCLAVLSASRSPWARALAALLAGALVLRARTFSFRRHMMPLLVSGAIGLAAVASMLVVDLAGSSAAWWLPVLAGGVAVVGLVVAAAVELPASAAARGRRVLDFVERALVAAALPVLAGLLGLYAEVHERFS